MNISEFSGSEVLYATALRMGSICDEDVETPSHLFVAVNQINGRIQPGSIVAADQLGDDKDIAWLLHERAIRRLTKAETWFAEFMKKDLIDAN